LGAYLESSKFEWFAQFARHALKQLTHRNSMNTFFLIFVASILCTDILTGGQAVTESRAGGGGFGWVLKM